jgi:hypothetical protein
MTARVSFLRALPSRVRRPVVLTATLTLAAVVGAGSASASGSGSTGTGPPALASTIVVVNAFDINPPTSSLIAVRGTKPGVVSLGDQVIIDQQLTSVRKGKGGYPIIGYSSGTCTFTRVSPDGQGKGSPYDNVVQDCIATAVLPGGDLMAQGIVTMKSGVDQASTLAVTTGTGEYEGAHGTLEATFGKDYDTYRIELQMSESSK